MARGWQGAAHGPDAARKTPLSVARSLSLSLVLALSLHLSFSRPLSICLSLTHSLSFSLSLNNRRHLGGRVLRMDGAPEMLQLMPHVQRRLALPFDSSSPTGEGAPPADRQREFLIDNLLV